MSKQRISRAHFRDKGITWWTREDTTPHDEFVFHKLGKMLEGRALEIGPGRGSLVFRIRDLGWRVSAIDVNREFIDHCRKKGDCTNIDFICGDAIELPFKNGIFDAVICVDVLMHIPNPRKMFIEFSRILKPTGIILVSYLKKYSRFHIKRIFTVATGIYERKYGKESFDYRYDSLRDIKKYIRDAKFIVSAISNRKLNPCLLMKKSSATR